MNDKKEGWDQPVTTVGELKEDHPHFEICSLSEHMYKTNLVALDKALAEGKGLPPGSLLELYGATDSGKTALALWYCKTLLEKPDAVAGWVCTEANLSYHSLEWAGIPMDRMVVIRQSPYTPGLQTASELLDNGCDLVVVDSIAALVDEDLETPLYSLLSRELPILKRKAAESGGLVVLTNQERNIGVRRVVSSAGTGPALLRTMDYRVRLRAGEGLYRSGIQKGARIHFEVLKNGEDIDSIGRAGKLSIYWDRGYRDLKSTLVEAGKLTG